MKTIRMMVAMAAIGAAAQASAADYRVMDAPMRAARGETVALNPQPIPPGRSIDVAGGDTRIAGPRVGPVALNPQPIPPGRMSQGVSTGVPRVNSGPGITGPRGPVFR